MVMIVVRGHDTRYTMWLRSYGRTVSYSSYDLAAYDDHQSKQGILYGLTSTTNLYSTKCETQKYSPYSLTHYYANNSIHR